MSFCKDTKNDLCALPSKNRCCKRALLYGMLLSGNVFTPEKIRLITEHERTSELILSLLRSVYKVEGNLYISEKRSGEGKISSYKLTVSAKDDLKTVFEDFRLPEDCEGAVNPQMLVCDQCLAHFLRGAFLTAGTLTDPSTGYRLELIFEDLHLANTMLDLLEHFGFPVKYTVRKTSGVVYIKDSSAIEDMLTFIGATKAAVSIMNMKIYRDIRNEQNRRSNCDAANINKMTGKAQEHIRMIRALKNAGIYDLISEDLKMTADLREENPEASLVELAMMHTPPITKSGVNHRLAKIAQHYENLRKKEK